MSKIIETCKLHFCFNKLFSSPDAIVEQQIWKTQVDLKIFQDLMSGDYENAEAIGKSRYIKYKQNSSVSESGDSEQVKAEEATGGEAAGDGTVVEQIFLETTV